MGWAQIVAAEFKKFVERSVFGIEGNCARIGSGRFHEAHHDLPQEMALPRMTSLYFRFSRPK